jgi:hypothetical protein
MDYETQQALDKGEKLKNFVQSEVWQMVKEYLLEKLGTLNTIGTLDFNKPPEQIVLEAQTRANTVKIIYQWITEVEGMAAQHADNQQVVVTEEIIKFNN